MSFSIDWQDWSLNRIVSRWPDGKPFELHQLFALRCGLCLRFSLGCDEHWFCGLCEACKHRPDEDDAA